jgi:hypothetical protein
VWREICCKVCTDQEFRLSVEEIVQRNKEKIKEGKLRRESGGNIQGKKSLKFSLKSVDKIHSQREKNDSRPLDLVKLQGG